MTTISTPQAAKRGEPAGTGKRGRPAATGKPRRPGQATGTAVLTLLSC